MISKRSALKNAPQTAPEELTGTALKIIQQIQYDSKITLSEISKETGISRRWVASIVKNLQEREILKRIGPNKGGHWEISIEYALDEN